MTEKPRPSEEQTTAAIPESPFPGERAEHIRAECIRGRRLICGKVLKILPTGLVVDSGYASLAQPPFNQSWVVSSGATVSRDPHALELNDPGSPCIGMVFLTDIPRRPDVNQYDYVVIQGYPAGEFRYTPVPGVTKTLRQFSAGLATAVRLNLEGGEE